MDQVVDQQIHRIHRIAPESRNIAERPTLIEPPFLADNMTEARELVRHPFVALDDLVEGFCNPARDAAPVKRQAHRGIAFLKCIERTEYHGQLFGIF